MRLLLIITSVIFLTACPSRIKQQPIAGIPAIDVELSEDSSENMEDIATHSFLEQNQSEKDKAQDTVIEQELFSDLNEEYNLIIEDTPDDQNSAKSLIEQFLEVKNKFDTSQYPECVCLSINIIKKYENGLIKEFEQDTPPNDEVVVLIYEILSDCLSYGLNKVESSIAVLESAIKNMGDSMSDDEQARLGLKIGNIYKNSGLYDKALSQYQFVEEKYKNIFPDRYAEYAREYMEEITERKVSQVSGKVELRDDSGCGGIRVLVKNGFEESETKTSVDCKYSLPLFSSTVGTKFLLYILKDGYTPHYQVITFDGLKDISVEPLVLNVMKNRELGLVTGSAYGVIIGGQITSHHGIQDISKDYKIEIHNAVNDNSIITTTDDNGQYSIYLEPGSYWAMKEGKKYKFTLKAKEAVVIDFGVLQTLVD